MAEKAGLAAVRNMLMSCAGASPGERLLILREDPRHGYYGDGLAERIREAAGALGFTVTIIDVPVYPEVDRLPRELEAAFRGADHALFLARLGDQIRFLDIPDGARPIVSYVLDTDMLSSPFATAPYEAFLSLKHAFDDMFGAARSIRVSCPRGTTFEGCLPEGPAGKRMDVTIRRFPMSIFAPIDATGFSGRVAVARFLAGTGSRYYEPYSVAFDGTAFAEIEGGRIAGWSGPDAAVSSIRGHYAFVADRYGIDAGVVHSWHAGIHPACAYAGPADASFERWSGGAFGNPRLLHFHTCGAYAPGEICWNVVDPTLAVDGRTVWRSGRIDPAAVPGVAAILQRYPEVASLFEAPARDIGLD